MSRTIKQTDTQPQASPSKPSLQKEKSLAYAKDFWEYVIGNVSRSSPTALSVSALFLDSDGDLQRDIKSHSHDNAAEVGIFDSVFVAKSLKLTIVCYVAVCIGFS